MTTVVIFVNHSNHLGKVMAAIDSFVAEIKAELLQNLGPSPARSRDDLETNDFGNTRFGPEGTIVVGYLSNLFPLAIRVIGADEDMSILSNPLCHEIRTIMGLDLVSAQKYAEILESTLSGALVGDESGRRRIRRHAGQGRPKASSNIPEGFTKDLKTGEIRPKLRVGRRPASGADTGKEK